MPLADEIVLTTTDDERQRLVNADHTYLNKPLRWEEVPEEEQVVVLAEEWTAVWPDIRRVLFTGELDFHYHPLRYRHADNALGRHRRELELW